MESGLVMVVMSNPSSEADDEEYNRWYDEVHTQELLAQRGISRVRRLKFVAPVVPGVEPAHKYLAIYDIADAEAATSLPDGWVDRFIMSDAVDLGGSVASVFEEIFRSRPAY